MKYFLIFFIACTLQANSQTVTTIIDYQTWIGATGCNVFSGSTTINNVAHQSTIGQPTYDGTNHVVSLTGHYEDNSQTYLGTEYRIAYSFKAGYSYSVSVNAISIVNQGYLPYLRLRLASSTSTTTSCSGAQTIDNVTTGGLTNSSQIGNTAYVNYTFDFGTLSSAVPYLTVALVPQQGGGYQTILIKSITITETATVPNPAFSLSPTSFAKVCGTALTQTFTVNNVNNTAGVTGYVWNLGSAANGWTYNGAAAPQTIATATNTLTLTAAACVSALQNVTATANVGSTSYNTNTSTVTSNYSFSISGPNSLCAPTTYTVSNLSCNATVTWSVTQSGAVTLNPTTGPQTTLTKSTNVTGAVTLNATINNACGKTVATVKRIGVDAGVPNFGIQANVPCQPGTIVQSSTFTAVPSTTGVIYHWRSVSNGVSFNITGSGPSISKKFPLGSHQVYAWGENSCGSSDETVVNFNVVSCPNALQSSGTITVSPNPTTDNITIAAAKPKDAVFSKTGKAMIYQLKVTDPLGNVRKEYKYSSGTSNTNISLKGLISGMYTIQVFDGTSWSSVQVIKQ